MRLNKLIVLAFLFVVSTNLLAQKPIKVKGVQGRWEVSGDITMKIAEERALLEAQKNALQKAGVMENVWSVFGQITQENGTELYEAYSQMNVLAIGGMMNITDKKVEEIWDSNIQRLYKVVTIDAIVQPQEPDKSYAIEVKEADRFYKEGDNFTCKLFLHGTDSYLKIFWFDELEGSLIYPNDYEKNVLFTTNKEYSVPFNSLIEYRIEKQKKGSESEKINIMMVATKENIPFTGEVTYQNVLKWTYSIPANQRCAHYDMLLIK
ncbi:DUF4384 domain-containing protein [Bacteroides sp. 519]|uniref:DUF4384 domain-containing protein n=1 Tax=Bacteroides sp. 519 TaxID=2302937 RepID=UPI0013D739F2|nr:DUF4384 domain-containing protein [Bacteroides sp. 519]NDV59471.1 DUF4384 domain-containing protein [Bacteroides sp. 519]